MLLAGCDTLSVRGDRPIWSTVANTSLNTTISCVINGLNTVHPGSITHSAQIIDPDRVAEIAPQQVITIGAEIYFVRLTALSASSTNIELNAVRTWAPRLSAAIAPCGVRA